MEVIQNIFNKISFSGKSIADLILFLIALFAMTMSLVLFFHWKKYGMGGALLAFMELTYFVVSAALILIAFLALN